MRTGNQANSLVVTSEIAKGIVRQELVRVIADSPVVSVVGRLEG